MKLKVYRYKDGMSTPRYDTFEIEPSPGMSVLGALFQVQEKFDDSLAFHYSCRGAVCGTCAMLINKVPRLACRTQVESLIKGNMDISLYPYPEIEETVEWDPKDEILVEPLPHLPVIRDLIVDMDEFFEKYKYVEPVFKPSSPTPEKERLMESKVIPELELYTNCILCAACYGACPVNGINQEYLGPAALAKLYRFYIDPREEKRIERLKRADFSNGLWACKSYSNCTRVCPKGIPPTIAIAMTMKELMDQTKNDEE